MSEPLVAFEVGGVPVPQGSHRIGRAGGKASGRPIILPDNDAALVEWRGRVTWRARGAWRNRPPIDEPLFVVLLFRFGRPATVRREWPAVKPDLDKLTRAVFDAITEARVWTDDARVCRMTVEKSYAGEPGCAVGLYSLAELVDEAGA